MSLVLFLVGIVVCVLVEILVAVLTGKGKLSQRYCIVSTIVLLFTFIFGIYLIIPYINDYNIVKSGEFPEENAVVVEFTYISDDLDGNGQTQYLKPKFYIESKDEYIVLSAVNVEINKEYRIRYLPNTKICEVLYCIDDQ